jgi:hypothetical protein
MIISLGTFAPEARGAQIWVVVFKNLFLFAYPSDTARTLKVINK